MTNFKPLSEDITKVQTPAGPMKRQVVCAANKWGDTIILGVRHFCPLMSQAVSNAGLKGTDPHEQGFVDQWGNFMTRKEALHILKTNGRWIRDDNYSNKLFSENLY